MTSPSTTIRPVDSPAIVWFRRDLRVADNPALHHAVERGGPVVPVFILDADPEDGPRPPGGAGRWWLHHSLERLAETLRGLGSPLVLRRGDAVAILAEMAEALGAEAVMWNHDHDPGAAARDDKVREALTAKGIAVESFNGALLVEPEAIRSKAGTPFKVFTPFWKTLSTGHDPARPLPAPAGLRAPAGGVASDRLEDWGLLPVTPDWAGGLREDWVPGEAAAGERLTDFLDEIVRDYRTGRDRPGRDGTSRLSPRLRWGEISPRQVWHAARMRADDGLEPAIEAFLREIGWREFTHGLLVTNPDLGTEPMDKRFNKLRWRDDDAGVEAWRRGKTGYPIVDAGMRQLWQTGWMHNRVRMITGSFLVKDLLARWQIGEEWFWDTLVDACPANNTANWQWIAGCGADPAPFFRVFNPVLQGRKFDPEGDYVRQFVPELAELPNRYIHEPWNAPTDVLAKAGVELGTTYPNPIVDHGTARDRALAAFREMRAAARDTAPAA
ncbi:deoxyribodipyrimidine photo-lyase [Skermanella stibiiresistens SB22]|uniref:Deoxyribodipyrimidine photo-lyase n=1 Tax=Skermanella stibiiresistens SB22 TaxID=1385369 RepID=W9HBB5_9PROT|nr:deoxyribodipyrimidine photo-lyase [Skermanella stibiiresistens]EWY42036.1 deoxyribodipyrimidine photo-lyase [Skermanella stibiiresistens SB22]